MQDHVGCRTARLLRTPDTETLTSHGHAGDPTAGHVVSGRLEVLLRPPRLRCPKQELLGARVGRKGRQNGRSTWAGMCSLASLDCLPCVGGLGCLLCSAWLELALAGRNVASRCPHSKAQRHPRGRVAANFPNTTPCYWTRQAAFCHLRSFFSACFAFLPRLVSPCAFVIVTKPCL